MTRSTVFPKDTFIQIETTAQANPCLSCGACCAYYRASFYWRETDDAGGSVPFDLTEEYDSLRRAIRGTNQPNPRCVALVGEIGVRVECSIYDRRPSVCREFACAGQDGESHDKCDRARIAWGLAPLLAPVTPDSTGERSAQ